MKVLSSPENKKIYSEKDIKQFIGLYHLGAINPLDDPVLTGIVLEALHQQNETTDKPPQTLKLKIFKYSFFVGVTTICLALISSVFYFASKTRKM